MSAHTDSLRDIAANHGWPVCDLAADEIEDLERAYALLFAENAKLRASLSTSKQAGVEPVAYLLTRPSGFAWPAMPKDLSPTTRAVHEADGTRIDALYLAAPGAAIAAREQEDKRD